MDVSLRPEITESYMGFVEYLPEVEQNGLIDWHPFVKKDRFKYQNEFRITFVSDNADPVMLDLGCSLRDIRCVKAIPVMSARLESYSINWEQP